MASMELDIKKFDKNKNFGLWQVKMKVILVQYGVKKAFGKLIKCPME